MLVKITWDTHNGEWDVKDERGIVISSHKMLDDAELAAEKYIKQKRAACPRGDCDDENG